MAEIRFWKWQQTDEFGMPCVTRFRVSAAGVRKPQDAPEGPGGDLNAVAPPANRVTAPPPNA
jgi:hypothetical protein